MEKISKIKEKEVLKTTSINSFELLNGFHALNKKEDSLLEFLNNLGIVNFNFETSKKAAEIFDELRKKGEMIDPLDLFIAAMVVISNEKLLTRNVKHFSRIRGLELENID